MDDFSGSTSTFTIHNEVTSLLPVWTSQTQNWDTGLSNWIEIESYFDINSNVFAQIEPNCIQIESNDFLDFWYNLIRFDLDKNLDKKKVKLRQEKWNIYKTES